MSSNKELYEQRLKRVNDALALKEPDQVPCAPMYTTYPYLYAGYTMAETYYDADIALDAMRKYLNHFQPDMAYTPSAAFAGQVPMIDKIGVKWLSFPGQEGSTADDRALFQYLEEDYMKEDEYDELLSDFTGWMMRKYLPRAFKIAEPLADVDFRTMIGYGFMPGTLQFANPAIAETFVKLGEIAGDYMQFYQKMGAFQQEIQDMGIVQQMGATSTAAFDKLSDCLRGTIGTLKDLRKQPDKVKQVVELFYASTLAGPLAQAKNSNGRFVFIPLHKGMDKFLSDEQYKTLYWDTLLRMINGLVDAGLTPWIYTEGAYDTRVECLMDVPKGKCFIHFEEADMRRAKKLLGKTACISGGLRSHVLMIGSKEQVVDKVKENLDILAPGGGFIFDLADTMEDCKTENVEAMFETVRTYGKY